MVKRIEWLLVVAWAWAATAQAGGHFDVDDAGMLAPGECQYEVWGGHGTPRSIDFAHLGPACRVGPVELGLNVDWAKGDFDRVDLLGPQVKWVFFGQEEGASLAVALSVGAVYDVRKDGRWGGQLILPLTCMAGAAVAGGERQPRLRLGQRGRHPHRARRPGHRMGFSSRAVAAG